MFQTKQIIYGDGVDMVDVYLDGEIGETVTYTISGEPFQAVLEDVGGFGRETLQISSDTPNTTIVVECKGERAIIHVVGEP